MYAGAPRDGDHARRRAGAAHPRPSVRPCRHARRGRRRRPTDRRRAGLGRRRDGPPGRRATAHPSASERGSRPQPRSRSDRRRRATSTDAADRADRPRRALAAFDGADVDRRRRSRPPAARSARSSPTTDAVAEASRDWWPLALHWALAGEVPQLRRRRRAGRRRPTQVAAVAARLQRRTGSRSPPPAGAAACAARRCPCSAASCSTSPRCRASSSSTPPRGVVEVLAGHVRPRPRGRAAQTTGSPVGHLPQSFDIATVGGWVACRGAGQYSTRYGKIEDMVVGLEVVLADGTVVRTGGAPGRGRRTRPHPAVPRHRRHARRHHQGRGSRTHPAPGARAAGRVLVRRRSSAGLEACRRDPAARRHAGGAPPVRRRPESARWPRRRRHALRPAGARRGRRRLVDATMAVVDEECAAGGVTCRRRRSSTRGCDHRNDTSALQALTRKGFVVDTMEIAAPWSALPTIFDDARARRCSPCRTARAATCHLSHSYPDGAASTSRSPRRRRADEIESTYVALWDAGQRAVLAARRQPVAPPRRRPEPRPLRGRGARRRPTPCCSAVKAALDPARHPQPGQARPRRPRSARCRGRDRRGPPDGTLGRPGDPRGRLGRRAVRRAVHDHRPPRLRRRRQSGWASVLASRRRSLGFVLGAGVRRWRQQRGTPLATASSPRSACSSSCRSVFVVIRLARRQLDVNWFGKSSFSLSRRRLGRAPRRAPRQLASNAQRDAHPRRSEHHDPHRSSSSTSARAACGPPSSAPTSRSSTSTTAPFRRRRRSRARRVRRRRDGRRGARGRDGRPRRRRPGRRRRHRQPARLDDRVGPRHGRAGRAGARLAGPAHGRRLHRREGRARPGARARTSRPPRSRGCSNTSTPSAPGTSASARSTPGWRGCCRDGALHVTDRSNAAVTGLLHGDASTGTSGCSKRSASPPRCCPTSSIRPA